MSKNKLLLLLALLMTAATGAWAQDAKHLIKATHGEQTRLLEQPLPYATTIGELYEAVTGGQSFSDLISTMSALEMPLTGISSRITSVASIGDLNGASTPVTVKADGETTISLRFGSYAQAIYISVTSPLYVTMKEGTEDAAKWTATVGTNSTAQPLPVGGLSEGDQVTIQYSGRLKVKGVKATSDAAAAAVPDGAINGKFSVSDGKQVYFSKGNLRYASSKWSFFDNQYDFYTSYSADAWDKFGWSTSATTYGMSTSSNNDDYSGDFVDWGATMGAGWRTLTSDEWTYLLKTRSASTVGGTENGRYAKAKVNNVQGVILFPDTYTHPDGVTAPTGVNATNNTGWNGNSYTAEDWTKMETAGCVFLPAAGDRNGSSVFFPGTSGFYWSATPTGAGTAYNVYFSSSYLFPTASSNRSVGSSVRLVKATSDAAPAVPNEVLTYSFDDASHPSGLTAGSRVSFDYSRTSVITNSTFLNAYNNTNGDPNATTVSLGDTDLSGVTWTLSFEWAACGGCNSKPDHTTLKAGNATLFDLSGNSNWNTTVTIIYTGSDGSKTLPVPGCDKSNRFTEAVGDQYNTTNYWHHIVVKGSAEGVKMTITNSSTGAAVVEDVVLSETNVNPTSLIIEPCCGGGIGIDALSLTYEE